MEEKLQNSNNEKKVTEKPKKRNYKPRKKKTNQTRESKIEQVKFKKENLKIIPLGGLLEIGKNITVFEYGNDIILVDCGLAFPEDDMLGIDLVIPDLSYLEKKNHL